MSKEAIKVLHEHGVEPHFHVYGEFKNIDGTVYVPNFGKYNPQRIYQYDPQQVYRELRAQMKQK